MPAAGAEAATVKTFGDLPLIVLTAKLNNFQCWQEWQTELLQLSSNSQQLFADNSGHNIQLKSRMLQSRQLFRWLSSSAKQRSALITAKRTDLCLRQF